eukprot:scaffold411_cov66-Phaeocystis_antarctica.AAC.2
MREQRRRRLRSSLEAGGTRHEALGIRRQQPRQRRPHLVAFPVLDEGSECCDATLKHATNEFCGG